MLGKTTLVSVDLDGTEIAFASDATNLVDGGTAAGETNIYVAKLTEGATGPQVQSITLISEDNGQQGEGDLGDGTQALVAGAESGI